MQDILNRNQRVAAEAEHWTRIRRERYARVDTLEVRVPAHKREERLPRHTRALRRKVDVDHRRRRTERRQVPLVAVVTVVVAAAVAAVDVTVTKIINI